MFRTFRVPVVISFAIVGGLVLTGCAFGQQSLEEACSDYFKEAVKAQPDLEAAVIGLFSGEGDPADFDPALDGLAKAAEKVTNQELSAVLSDNREVLKQFQLLADDANFSEGKLSEVSEELKKSSEELEELCGE